VGVRRLRRKFWKKKPSHFAKSTKIVDLGHKKLTIIDSLDNKFNHRWLGMEGLDLHCKILGFATNHFLVSSIRIYCIHIIRLLIFTIWILWSLSPHHQFVANYNVLEIFSWFC
jgi:hypothetical protein